MAVSVDSNGYSLELINQKAYNSVFSNWKVSETKYGTPSEPQASQQFEAVLYPDLFTNKV